MSDFVGQVMHPCTKLYVRGDELHPMERDANSEFSSSLSRREPFQESSRVGITRTYPTVKVGAERLIIRDIHLQIAMEREQDEALTTSVFYTDASRCSGSKLFPRRNWGMGKLIHAGRPD